LPQELGDGDALTGRGVVRAVVLRGGDVDLHLRRRLTGCDGRSASWFRRHACTAGL
jgi:hypothetical protein